MSAQSYEVLLDRYASRRDDADFRPLVERYAPLVYAACAARLGRRELAEDATQAVFLLPATKAPRVRASPTLAPWLLAASRNVSMRLARSERRRGGRELPLDDALAAPAVHGEIGLVEAIGRLHGTERDAVVLRFVQNLSLAEVGAQLGISEDAARMRVQRALARLRRDLAPLAAVSPSLTNRLAQPLAATALLTKLATQGSTMNSTPLLLLVPVGVALTLGASSLAHRDAPPLLPVAPEAAPLVNSAIPKPTAPSLKVKPGARFKEPQLEFEKYLGKDQAWFAKRFGPGDGGAGIGGGRTGGPAPLDWTTYDRRPDLGGDKWQMASATYIIGVDPERRLLKALAITFESPVGGRPVATRASHGVDPNPRSFEQEAAYVGVNPAEYDDVPPDHSNAEDRRMVNHKHPELVLTASNVDHTWNISLQIDPRSRR